MIINKVNMPSLLVTYTQAQIYLLKRVWILINIYLVVYRNNCACVDTCTHKLILDKTKSFYTKCTHVQNLISHTHLYIGTPASTDINELHTDTLLPYSHTQNLPTFVYI